MAEGICFIPPTIAPDYAARRALARETLTEILVADLGDATSKAPYLIVSLSNSIRRLHINIPSYEPQTMI